jgi:hypothetical protein
MTDRCIALSRFLALEAVPGSGNLICQPIPVYGPSSCAEDQKKEVESIQRPSKETRRDHMLLLAGPAFERGDCHGVFPSDHPVTASTASLIFATA